MACWLSDLCCAIFDSYNQQQTLSKHSTKLKHRVYAIFTHSVN